MNFNSILIGSEDPKRLADFYTKLFGEPAFVFEPYTGWQIGVGNVTVGPHDEVKGTNASPGRLIWNMVLRGVSPMPRPRGRPSVKARSGWWHEEHDTWPFRLKRASKKNDSPRDAAAGSSA